MEPYLNNQSIITSNQTYHIIKFHIFKNSKPEQALLNQTKLIMKRHFLIIAYAAFFAVFIQFTQAQNISYNDSWGKQGFSVSQQSGQGLELNYSLTDFSLTDVDVKGTLEKSVHIPGVFLPNDAGLPDLPGEGRYIAVPQGAEVVVNIKAQRTEVFNDIDIAPAPVIPLDTDPTPLPLEKNQQIYSSNELYPMEAVKVSEKFKIRGVDVVMLGITPFQYNPVTKQLIVYRDIIVEVDFIGGNGQFGESRFRSRWWDPILQSSLINAKSLPEVDYSAQLSTKADEYEYIIITPDQADFITWANTIKDFRTKQGIKTGVVTLTDIGGNTVSAIEAYVDNAYNSWSTPPSAVLLLGDYSTGSDGIISPMYVHPAGYPDFASDNRYADVDNVGIADLPDITFARITARDAAELETMITKFINYETNPPTDPNFYYHPITALGWQTERWFQICSETVGGYFKNVQGKDPVRINKVYSGTPGSTWSTATNTSTVVNYFANLGYIPTDPSVLGGFDGGTAADVINAINAGSFLLQHRDHGYYYGWGEPSFTYNNIGSLTNVDNKLPFIFSINCQTGAFHRNDPGEESFTERFHRYTYNNQNSGALGLIAATEVSYSFVNDTYVWGLYDNMFPDFMPDESTQFPVAFAMPAFGNAAAKHFLYYSNWPYNTYNKQITYRLFHHHGDAFLTLYTEVPEYLTVNHPVSILNSDNSVSVNADDGSLIALVANGTILATANGTGNALDIPIPAQAAGTMITLTVTKQNFFRYEADITVTAGGLLADFTADNQVICLGEAVNFTDQSIGSINTWNWTFDGGSPAVSTSNTPVSIVYSVPGTYDVSLEVSDGSSSNTELKTAYITVQDLQADFSASQTTIQVGGSVTFTNLSVCGLTYDWDFQGGTPAVSQEENPGPVVFNTAGEYNVTLYAHNGTNSDFHTVTIYVLDIQYCSSYGNPANEWIQSFDIGGQANVSGQSSTGYSDFTGITYNLDPGSANTITLIPGFSGRSTFEYWKVWIDFNMDGDFNDVGEEVLSAPKKKSVVESTLNIPSTASGTTIMRVSMKQGASATSCEEAFPGEVEDYTVSFVPPVPQPPVAEFSADKTSIAVGGTVAFTDESLNEPGTWNWTFPGGTPASSSLQNPSVVYNTIGTYDVTLEVINAEGNDILTKTAYINVSESSGYDPCIPFSDNTGDWIQTITINSITHNSDQGSTGGYDYFTSPAFSFSAGATYNVSLTPFNDRNRNFWRIWIDFNMDGDFDDVDETLLVANNKKGTITTSITIPTGISTIGVDRMRVMMKTGGSPTSCETNFSGETEDYDVNFGAELFTPHIENELSIKLYPNPADNILNIELQGKNNGLSVKVYDALGSLVQSFMMENSTEQISLDAYHQGLYFIHFNDGNQMHLMKFIVR